MKYLIVLFMLLPLWGHAQVKERVCETERVITKEDGRVLEERRIVCKDQTKEIFSDCERGQWNSPWGVGNVISCNWNEREAMNATLTHAPNGVKVEWYDNVNGKRGYWVVAWTRPQTQSGTCRDIVRVLYNGAVPESTIHIMCYDSGRQAWVAFK